MREPAPARRTPILEIRGLNVYYGASHALQGVDLRLDSGVLSVVGRNGMGKTTLCQAITGLVPTAGGTISVAGRPINGLTPSQIARLGVGYVPQGRRLWPSLTVDEHLRMVAASRGGAWTVDRAYATFPRLAERKSNRGGQLSGGEQQMLAIARALLLNPRLLVMDEPTEGLAPVIVNQLTEMLIELADEGEVDVLVIEQNIGVATAVAQRVAIMVNGRINREIESAVLAGDRDLQQQLLGVGRHGHEEAASVPAVEAAEGMPRHGRLDRIYLSNPTVPNRWSQPVPAARIEHEARTISTGPASRTDDRPRRVELRPLAVAGEQVVLVAGTLDTKGEELRFIRDVLREQGLHARLVDLSTSGRQSSADIPPHQVAAFHPRGVAAVLTNDRGTAVAAMTEAFEAWLGRQSGIAGMIAAGGSGGTALVAPAMRALPIGVPKVLISTVASGEVRQYVGAADIMMLHSVADVQGLNAITRQVLANGANALAGMVAARTRSAAEAGVTRRHPELPPIGLTMFGVTTPAVRQVTAALKEEYDCLVFHATGIGGESMEKLVDSGLLTGVIDLTTTEVCDMMMGGIFPADEDRFGAIIRARMPYVGSCGALDMVNFAAPETVPGHYRGRHLYEHNPQITLMRTTADENRRIGQWIGERLNLMDAPVRFFLPEGGVSALDAPGQPFHDPDADAALFAALESTVRQTSSRQLVRLPCNINDPQFAAAVVAAFHSLHGGSASRRRVGR